MTAHTLDCKFGNGGALDPANDIYTVLLVKKGIHVVKVNKLNANSGVYSFELA
jgi:hypothetical protein